MTATPRSRTFDVRHVQFARAVFAAIAAVMITFSPDHSAEVGAAVFSGFAIATGLIWLVSLWLVYPAGRRAPALLLAMITLAAGMLLGLEPLRTVSMWFAVVIAWAALSGIVELAAGWRALRQASGAAARAASRRGHVEPWSDGADPLPAPPRAQARDAVTVGIVTLVLGAALLFVPTGYALNYTIAEAGETFTLTGITIGVGIFGGYAAIVAVYLAIAGFSPRPATAVDADITPADAHERTARADQKDSP